MRSDTFSDTLFVNRVRKTWLEFRDISPAGHVILNSDREKGEGERWRKGGKRERKTEFCIL